MNSLRSIAIAFICSTASIAFAACGAGISGGGQAASSPVMTIAAAGTTGLDITLSSGSSGYTLYAGNPSLWANLQPGGYVAYSVNVPVAGTYGLQAYYATASNAGANLLVNGAQQSALNLPSSGGWNAFTMSQAAAITLPAGESQIEIAAQPSFQAYNLAGLAVTPVAVGGGAPAAAPAAATASSGSNPLSGDKFYVSLFSQVGQNISGASCSSIGSPGQLSKLANVAQGVWFNGDPTVLSEVQGAMALAAAQQAVPILVAYNIPDRDCGGFSSGGASSDSAYQQWITQFAQGIGQAKAAVVLEPDAISQMSAGCLSSSQISDRENLLSFAVQTIASIAPKASVYIDAGHGDDNIPAATIAGQLSASGVANAAGFALNVANYVSTADNTSYGQQISSLINNKHFIIDTSRNGTATANGVWCNPPNQGAGTPTVGLSSGAIDGYLWVQNPGTSDGACGGMSGAGQWDLAQACSLATNANF